MIYSSITSFVAASLLSSVSATATVQDPKELFEDFKAKFGRIYASKEEELARLTIFLENLKVIERRNAAERGTATHGITRFSDLTEEEFATTFLNLDISKKLSNATLIKVPVVDSTDSLVDWTGVYTTGVKDQVS